MITRVGDGPIEWDRRTPPTPDPGERVRAPISRPFLNGSFIRRPKECLLGVQAGLEAQLMKILGHLGLRTKLALILGLSIVALVIAVGAAASMLRQRMLDDRLEKVPAQPGVNTVPPCRTATMA